MNQPTLKILASSLTALSLACATVSEETKPAPAATTPAPATQALEAAKPAPPPPSPTPDAEFRARKPEPLPVTPKFTPPVPVQRKLKNGIPVLVVENHALPLVAIQVVVFTGSNGDPLNKSGLAGFTAALLDEGTRTRKALEISAALDDLAAELSGNASLETSRLHLNCLVETLPQALPILADVLQNPAFRPEDLERVRALLLTSLEQKRGVPSAIASDESLRQLFGDKHPWGQPDGGTPATIKAITRADLVAFHDAWYRPNNAVISVSGDVTPDAVVALLEKNLGGWKAKPLPKLNLPPPPELSRHVVAVDKPNASQSQVWMVGRLFPATHPDAVAMKLANYSLGGLFTSRLNLNLREDKGYSYAVHSFMGLMRNNGQIMLAGGIVAKDTAKALAEYEKEVAKLATGDVANDELNRAKEAYIRSLPSILETNDAVASAMAGLATLGLPLDYYATLPDRVRAVTLDDVNRVARKYVLPDQWPAIVVGPYGQFGEELSGLKLGPVEQRPAP